jgi:hypothetical protein
MAESNNTTVTTAAADPIVAYCENVVPINNGAHEQNTSHMSTLTVAQRARLIERCTSMVGSVTETVTS